MILALVIVLVLVAIVLMVVAGPHAPAALIASCVAWTAQCWNRDRVLALQYAALGVLFLVIWVQEVRSRTPQMRRKA